MSITSKLGPWGMALAFGLLAPLASMRAATTIVNDTYSGSYPALISGTLANQGTVLEEAFSVASDSNLTAFTTSYATGGFEPNLVLYNPDGSFNTVGVTPGTSPIAQMDSTGNSFDGYLTAMSLTPGTYTLALMDWQVSQSILATNLSDGFAINGGDGTNFVDSFIIPSTRTGDYALTLQLTPNGPTATPEPATLWLTAPLLCGIALLARKRASILK